MSQSNYVGREVERENEWTLPVRSDLQTRHTLQYAVTTSLSKKEKQCHADKCEPLEFGHTLGDQLGGQLDKGFVITGFYENYHRGHPLAAYMPTYIATRSLKL